MRKVATASAEEEKEEEEMPPNKWSHNGREAALTRVGSIAETRHPSAAALFLLLLLFLQQIDGTSGLALVDKMNRFSTADKLNRSRPALGPSSRQRSGSQSYKDQLMSVILQQSANSSSFARPAPPEQSEPVAELPVQAADQQPPNGNMKSKDFGNGEGELDMLFGFFVMNGACIVFFLLFGVCVICNCAARKPKFAGNEQPKEKKRKKPTVSRLVAAMAPPGFGQRSKAAKAAAAAAEQANATNGGHIPLQLQTNPGSRRGSAASIRLDQNGNGGGTGGPMGAGSPLLSNHSPAQRSFKSLVTRAMQMAKGGDGGSNGATKQMAVNIEEEAEQCPQGEQQRRRNSRDVLTSSGANSPARRMSTLSSIEESTNRRVPKLSHCSATECCSLHVLEVPVEVEVHHCPPSPTGGSSLSPELAAALGTGTAAGGPHPKLAFTRSMPLDLATVAARAEQPQQICLTEHGQFIVRRETQSGWAATSRGYQSRHRCSLVVPIQMPCGECRVQVEEEDDDGEETEEGRPQNNRKPTTTVARASGSEEAEDVERADGQSSGSSRKPSAGGEFSVVRQNLLGPLSFDDLYYIS